MELYATGYLVAKKECAKVSKKTGKTNYWYTLLTSEGESKRAMSAEAIAAEMLSILGGRMVLLDIKFEMTDGGLIIISDVDISDN